MAERGGRPQFGEPVPKRRDKQQPAAQMFPDGADMPIFSGTPIPVVERPYVPESPSHKQEMLPGMPPIDYNHILELDKKLRRRRSGTDPPAEGGTIWTYERPLPEAGAEGEPHDDERRQKLHEALEAYHLNTRALRELVQMGADINKALKAGNAPPEILHLLTLISAMLRPSPREQIRSPADAAAVLMIEMGHLDQEELRTVLLDTKNRIQDIVTIYRGSLNTSLVRVGEVYKEAVRLNSAALIVAHNHPSSDPTPSPEDVLVTRQIVEAGKLLDVECLDHLVIGQGRWVSMRERGLGFDK